MMSNGKINGRRRSGRARYVVPALLAPPLAAAVAAAVIVAGSKPTIHLSKQALASLSKPLGGGQVVSVSAYSGGVPKSVPVKLSGNQIWPTRPVSPGERITVLATVKRPGWIAWLSGSEQHVRLSVVAPVAHVTSRFLTRQAGAPLMVDFAHPVTVAGAGSPGTDFDPRPLSAPRSSLALNVSGAAGTVAVSAAVRSWERPTTTRVSWFPRGRRATVVAAPKPGTRIDPLEPITLTFSRPVNRVLGAHRPPVEPSTPGVWHSVNAHTIVFRPRGYGYGLGATVNVLLPAGVRLIGARQAGAGATTATTASGTSTTASGAKQGATPVIGSWSVPRPSTEALQELLAELGYLPVTFTPKHPLRRSLPVLAGDEPARGAGSYAGPVKLPVTLNRDGIAPSVQSEERLIVRTPRGHFSWRYPQTPATLEHLFSPTDFTELTKGAVMAFENDHGLSVDGIAGPQVWRALIDAAVGGQRSRFGYTFVMVSEHEPETISVWHNGRIVVHGPANTGIAAAPTALGTYAVFEHLRVTTMSGLNPDGTPYHDPGIPWVSYFNGGDALHGFTRASYGFPQSLGCVEMPFAEAGAVWPYTPIGTIVNLS